MKKIILSLIAIVFTAVCVVIMLFSDRMNENQKPVNNKVQVMDTKKNSEVIKQSTNDLKQGTSEEKNKNISENKDINYNTEKKTYIATDTYKKMKMNEINGEIEHDKKVFFEENNKTNDAKKKTIKNNDKTEDLKDNDAERSEDANSSQSKESIPVFKVSKLKIKDSLTLADKEKLLSVAAKLSAIDYEKINKYLENGSDEDIRNTIKLLKSRLSDKDYEKVKAVAEKFINMDAVEQ
ncbi:hypothetical protein JMF89_01850 [Clostridiaceae bacterium UIB06]|uniref:Uncharacterized protein n=1 Tax=Clostridium thailandense TaxID=2794346 RepID=A0A949TP93_9CLOT|nr:hypothetical protein [Clostridium thailandense]MBV7276474.1 hypothetical protein [Clostridium thailandense]MCH5135960.1 hypothetical protein [Clostridiaceae bacterium UIB06]